jgi:hypothetical protein
MAFGALVLLHLQAGDCKQHLSKRFRALEARKSRKQPSCQLAIPAIRGRLQRSLSRAASEALDVLRAKYSDEALAQLLVAGRSASITKDTSTSIQIALLNKWLGEKKRPAIVSKLLSLDASYPMLQAYSTKFLATWGNAV